MTRDARSLGLGDVYDDETLAAIEGWEPRRGAEPAGPRLRAGVTGALLSASALALREALDDEHDRQPVVERDPGAGDRAPRWVTFFHVPGAPKASRIVVRPWLAPSIS